MATHFPLVFPVKEHTAVEVAKCLTRAFTLFDFPNEILSDQVSEFVSQALEVFLKECKVNTSKLVFIIRNVMVLWKDFTGV